VNHEVVHRADRQTRSGTARWFPPRPSFRSRRKSRCGSRKAALKFVGQGHRHLRPDADRDRHRPVRARRVSRRHGVRLDRASARSSSARSRASTTRRRWREGVLQTRRSTRRSRRSCFRRSVAWPSSATARGRCCRDARQLKSRMERRREQQVHHRHRSRPRCWRR
jgi:hypothetical protein